MNFLTSTSILILTSKIDMIDFINAIMIRILDMIIIINFFIENVILNVNILNFSLYSTR